MRSLTPEPDTFPDDAIKGTYADLLYTICNRERESLIQELFDSDLTSDPEIARLPPKTVEEVLTNRTTRNSLFEQ